MKTINLFSVGTWRMIIALIAAAILLHSCSSTHRIKTSEIKKVDSAGIISVKATAAGKSDSIKLSTKDSSGSTQVDLTFSDENGCCDPEDPKEKAADLAGPDSTPVKKAATKSYHYNIGGIPINSSQPLKTADININGKLSTFDLTHVVKGDSSSRDSGQQTHVVSNEVTKDKEITKHKFQWLPIAIGTAVTIFLIILWRRSTKARNVINEIEKNT